MQDKLLIITKIKKTILYLEKTYEMVPRKERVLKDHILKTSYQLLEQTTRANLTGKKEDKIEILVLLSMLEFDIKNSLEKKLINYKKQEQIGIHLLEIRKMVFVWMNYEKKK